MDQTMEKTRCFGTGSPLYEAYHDEEWGRAIETSPDERELFERLCLEIFQAGLSWLTVLKKREEFRRAFDGFAPAKVAAFDDAKVAELLANRGIIRNHIKVAACIKNARALIAMHEQGERLMDVISSYVPDGHLRPGSLPEMAPTVPEAKDLSKDLKRRGFTFVGPVTLYSTWQAIGLVNDHIAECWLAAEEV